MANGAIAKHKIDSLQGVFIWGKPDELDLFFNASVLSNVDKVDPAIRQSNMPTRSRRQYPGDTTPIRQGSHVRKWAAMGDVNRVALPGRSFWIELPSTPAGVKPVKWFRRQFSIQGNFTSFRVKRHIYLVDGAVLRSPSGKGYPVIAVPPVP